MSPYVRTVKTASGGGGSADRVLLLALAAERVRNRRPAAGHSKVSARPRQKAGSFSLDQVLQKLQEAGGGNK